MATVVRVQRPLHVPKHHREVAKIHTFPGKAPCVPNQMRVAPSCPIGVGLIVIDRNGLLFRCHRLGSSTNWFGWNSEAIVPSALTGDSSESNGGPIFCNEFQQRVIVGKDASGATDFPRDPPGSLSEIERQMCDPGLKPESRLFHNARAVLDPRSGQV